MNKFMLRLAAAWTILRAKKKGWAIITVDEKNTYLLMDLSPEEMLDAASHLAEQAGTSVEQDSAVNAALQIANGHR